MKNDKIGGKGQRDKKTGGEGTGKGRGQTDLREVRRRAVAAICPSVTAITRAVIEQAKSGNYLPAKFLFEFLGIYPAPAEEAKEEEDYLSRYLLRQLGITDPPTREEVEAMEKGETGGANAATVESS